jgi:hypothetical protein
MVSRRRRNSRWLLFPVRSSRRRELVPSTIDKSPCASSASSRKPLSSRKPSVVRSVMVGPPSGVHHVFRYATSAECSWLAGRALLAVFGVREAACVVSAFSRLVRLSARSQPDARLARYRQGVRWHEGMKCRAGVAPGRFEQGARCPDRPNRRRPGLPLQLMAPSWTWQVRKANP